MYNNVIQIPQIDVREFFGEDALHLGIERLALRGVDFAPRLID